MDKVITLIEKYMTELVEGRWSVYVNEDGDIELDEDAMLMSAIAWYAGDIADALAENESIKSTFAEIRLSIREAAKDAAEYQKNVLGYHGHRESDFV